MHRHEFARQLGKIDYRLAGNSKAQRKARLALVRRASAITIIINGKITGWRMRDGGVVCAKRRYSTWGAAVADLARIMRTANHAHIPVRAYRCPMCEGHHLTSRAV